MQTAVIRLRIIPLLCALIASLAIRAQEPADPERWIAGEIVPKEQIERCGISRCFTQREIDDVLLSVSPAAPSKRIARRPAANCAI